MGPFVAIVPTHLAQTGWALLSKAVGHQDSQA